MAKETKQPRVPLIFRVSYETAKKIKMAVENERKATGYKISTSEWLEAQITKVLA